jgi:hypothetical protein
MAVARSPHAYSLALEQDFFAHEGKRVLKATAIFCVAMLFATAASAADQSNAEIGLMAFLGYRGGGQFDALSGSDNFSIESSMSYGASLNWFSDSDTRYRLMYDFQPTAIHGTGVDLNVEHLHIDGALPFNATDKLVPYVVGGFGATRFRPTDYEDETDFSIVLGLGIDRSLGKRAWVTLEARTYLTWLNADSELFCVSGSSGGNCLVRASGSTLFDYEIVGGIGVRF